MSPLNHDEVESLPHRQLSLDLTDRVSSRYRVHTNAADSCCEGLTIFFNGGDDRSSHSARLNHGSEHRNNQRLLLKRLSWKRFGQDHCCFEANSTICEEQTFNDWRPTTHRCDQCCSTTIRAKNANTFTRKHDIACVNRKSQGHLCNARATRCPEKFSAVSSCKD